MNDVNDMTQAQISRTGKQWAVTLILWLLVLISAMAVVRSTHEARTQLNQLEVMRREAAQLHVQWGQYLLEQSAWSAYGRIEKQATEQLDMVIPRGEQLIVVSK